MILKLFQCADMILIIILTYSEIILYQQKVMELRICDFRNSKYQGETINKQPGGFGISLDQKYTFLITQWQHSIPAGPFAAFFDDSTKLYASESLNNQNCLIVYIKNECRLFKNRHNIVIDFPNIKRLIKIEQISKQPLTQNMKNKDKPSPNAKIIEQKRYSHENYQNCLSEMLQLKQIPTKFLSYQSFIKQTFKNKYRNLFNVHQTTKQFIMSFHQEEGLFIKLSKKTDKVMSSGFIGANNKQEMGRKYQYTSYDSSYIIQQYIHTEPSTCYQYKRGEPNEKDKTLIKANASSKQVDEERKQIKQQEKQCIRSLREYYKRSLTFINKYLNLNTFYDTKYELDRILMEVNIIGDGKHAQLKLQANGYQLDHNGEPIISTKIQEKNQNGYQVEDWKKQLDRTLAGRSKRKSIVQTNEIYDPPKHQPIYTRVLSPKGKMNQEEKNQKIESTKAKAYKKYGADETPYKYGGHETPKKYNQDSNRYSRNNPEYDIRNESRRDQADRSKSHKKLKYLDSEIEEQSYKHTQTKYHPERNTQYKENGSLYTGERRKSPISYKFKYTDEEGKENEGYSQDRSQYKASRRETAYRYNY